MHKLNFVFCIMKSINPLTPRSDRYIDSPYIFNAPSSRQVMLRMVIMIKKECGLVITQKNSVLANKETYGIG